MTPQPPWLKYLPNPQVVASARLSLYPIIDHHSPLLTFPSPWGLPRRFDRETVSFDAPAHNGFGVIFCSVEIFLDHELHVDLKITVSAATYLGRNFIIWPENG